MLGREQVLRFVAHVLESFSKIFTCEGYFIRYLKASMLGDRIVLLLKQTLLYLLKPKPALPKNLSPAGFYVLQFLCFFMGDILFDY